LRLEEGSDEEAVAGELDGAEFAVGIECGQLESGVREVRQVSPIHFVVAEILLFGFETLIDVREPAASLDPQAARTGQLRAASEPVGSGARHRMNDEVFRIGLVLRRIRVGDSQNIAGIL